LSHQPSNELHSRFDKSIKQARPPVLYVRDTIAD